MSKELDIVMTEFRLWLGTQVPAPLAAPPPPRTEVTVVEEVRLEPEPLTLPAAAQAGRSGGTPMSYFVVTNGLLCTQRFLTDGGPEPVA